MSDAHADRRPPSGPQTPLDLASAGQGLLDEARGLSSGRSAKSLTPGAHAPLTQTLLAVCAGQELSEHHANGPATIYLLQGKASVESAGGAIDLDHGQWAPIPDARHNLRAHEDTVALLTVAPTVASGQGG